MESCIRLALHPASRVFLPTGGTSAIHSPNPENELCDWEHLEDIVKHTILRDLLKEQKRLFEYFVA